VISVLCELVKDRISVLSGLTLCQGLSIHTKNSQTSQKVTDSGDSHITTHIQYVQ